MDKISEGFCHRLQRLGIADAQVFPIKYGDLLDESNSYSETTGGISYVEIAQVRAELSLLQMYECIRTIRSRLKAQEESVLAADIDLQEDLDVAYRILRRMRIPLAKEEAARGFPNDIDCTFGCHKDHGVGWFLGSEYILYREVSDRTLNWFERVRSTRLGSVI